MGSCPWRRVCNSYLPYLTESYEHPGRDFRTRGTRQGIVDRLAAALDKALDDVVQARLADLGGAERIDWTFGYSAAIFFVLTPLAFTTTLMASSMRSRAYRNAVGKSSSANV